MCILVRMLAGGMSQLSGTLAKRKDLCLSLGAPFLLIVPLISEPMVVQLAGSGSVGPEACWD